MKGTLISVGVTLFLSIAICFVSLFTVERAVYDMEDVCMQVIDVVEKGDISAGKEQMVVLAMTWERYQRWLTMLVPHQDIHNVSERYVEASVNLQREHFDDFHKSMALLEEALKHLRDQEPPSISNIL